MEEQVDFIKRLYQSEQETVDSSSCHDLMGVLCLIKLVMNEIYAEGITLGYPSIKLDVKEMPHCVLGMLANIREQAADLGESSSDGNIKAKWTQLFPTEHCSSDEDVQCSKEAEMSDLYKRLSTAHLRGGHSGYSEKIDNAVMVVGEEEERLTAPHTISNLMEGISRNLDEISSKKTTKKKTKNKSQNSHSLDMDLLKMYRSQPEKPKQKLVESSKKSAYSEPKETKECSKPSQNKKNRLNIKPKGPTTSLNSQQVASDKANNRKKSKSLAVNRKYKKYSKSGDAPPIVSSSNSDTDNVSGSRTVLKKKKRKVGKSKPFNELPQMMQIPDLQLADPPSEHSDKNDTLPSDPLPDPVISATVKVTKNSPASEPKINGPLSKINETFPSLNPFMEYRTDDQGDTVKLIPEMYSSISRDLSTLSSRLKQVEKYRSPIYFHRIPFIVGQSTTRSHHLGLNIQQVVSMINMRNPRNHNNADTKNQNWTGCESCTGIQGGSLAHSVASSAKQLCPILQQRRLEDIPEKEAEDMEEDPWVVEQREPGQELNTNNSRASCCCMSKKCVDYYKVLRSYLSQCENPLFLRMSDNMAEPVNNINHYHNELKHLLTKLHTEFSLLNKQYEEIQNEERDDKAAIKMKELDIELCKKEKEITDAMALYKDVVAMKEQMETNPESNNCPAPFDKPLYPQRQRTTAAVRLTKILRKIQQIQQDLQI